MIASENSNYKDNLKDYREERLKINTKLVQKSIEKIAELDGALSLNNVSKMTFAMANLMENEIGLSPSTISKNKVYKALINEAKYKQTRKSKINQKSFIPNGSMADIKLKNFELITINNQMKVELDSYKHIMKNYKENVPIDELKKYHEAKDYKLLLQVSKGLLFRILEVELAIIDDDTGELVVSPYGDDILLSKKALNLILED